MPTILTFTQPVFIYKIPNEIGFTLVYRTVMCGVSCFHKGKHGKSISLFLENYVE